MRVAILVHPFIISFGVTVFGLCVLEFRTSVACFGVYRSDRGTVQRIAEDFVVIAFGSTIESLEADCVQLVLCLFGVEF